MVAAVVVGRERALAIDRAAELAAPDDERVVEQAALLEVGDQRGRRLIGVAGTGRRSAWAESCAGPSRDERAGRTARPARPAGGPAGSCRRSVPRRADFGAVERRASSPARSTKSVSSGTLGLHAKGQLVLGDARGDFGVADRAAR